MKYKYKTNSYVEDYVNVNSRRYNAIHVGNAFNGYIRLANSKTNVTESMFWKDVKEFYKGEKSDFQYTSSLIGDFMIVHSISERR